MNCMRGLQLANASQNNTQYVAQKSPLPHLSRTGNGHLGRPTGGGVGKAGCLKHPNPESNGGQKPKRDKLQYTQQIFPNQAMLSFKIP